jgi:hypothetical protein
MQQQPTQVKNIADLLGIYDNASIEYLNMKLALTEKETHLSEEYTQAIGMHS